MSAFLPSGRQNPTFRSIDRAPVLRARAPASRAGARATGHRRPPPGPRLLSRPAAPAPATPQGGRFRPRRHTEGPPTPDRVGRGQIGEREKTARPIPRYSSRLRRHRAFERAHGPRGDGSWPHPGGAAGATPDGEESPLVVWPASATVLSSRTFSEACGSNRVSMVGEAPMK